MINAIRRLLPKSGNNASRDSSSKGQRAAKLSIYKLQQLHQLHRNLPWLVICGILLASAFLWQHLNAYSFLLIWVWTTLLMLMRYNLALRFRYRTETSIGHWPILSCAPALLGGSSVAIFLVQLMPNLSFALAGVVYLLLLAAMLTAMAFYAVYPPAFFCFAISAILPLVVELLWQGGQDSQLTSLGLLLATALISYANLSINRFLLKRYQLLERNDQLQLRLQQSQRELTRSQRQLSDRETAIHSDVSEDNDKQQAVRLGKQLRRARQTAQLAEQRLALALEAADLSLWEWNLSQDRFIQPQAMEMLGHRLTGHQGFVDSLKPLTNEQNLLRLKETMQGFLNGDSMEYLVQFRARHSNGQWIWLEDRGQATAWDSQGRIIRMTGTRRNITTEKQQQAESELFRLLSMLTNQAVCLLDNRYRFLQVNPSFCELTGYRNAELIGRKYNEISRHHDPLFYQEIGEKLHQQGFWSGEILEYRKDGSAYPVSASYTLVADPQSDNHHCLGIYSDLSDKQKTEDRLHFLASFDNLTGLGNRDLFLRRLTKATQQGKALTLILLNLDRFKQINESLGHEVGDQLLVQFSKRLRTFAQEAELVARTGSDEFALLLPGDPGLGSLMHFTEQLLHKAGREYRVGNHDLSVSVSAGISRFPQQSRDAPTLLQGASRALIEAKNFAGNHFHFYTDELADKDQQLPLLESALRKAVENKEFEVYYQPKLHLATGTIQGVEALVRWQHPQLGLIEPERFIYLAEENGLINAIGEQVLEQACRQAKTWLDEGSGEIRVSVNLSAQQLRQGDGFSVVERTLKKTGLDPQLLELELTESILLEENSRISNSIHRIRELGVSISIDDFGTGYASLSYLKRFPVTALKIDRSFISGIPDNENDCTITRAIIAMAMSLDLRVVAEGVEHPQHAEFLRRSGCDEIQGYLISKPVTAEELSALLKGEPISV
ncbi:EAL domain-containing protein [Aestuariirhabdus sp. Z084]|uniref:bifunctional diguanylate cyclase/phosphodiesterase n=1 Tax=Aestuariirhabdus haliotis TaxID=2918751 RepID=UPI00201B44E7|nr:GGDEF domain-containing phosphodiesterase [Aestuariirhabdus haliotis]MCL6414321.1 EAL domain-containing protein [Aestuariirhabdus haliotis]MCL6418253.1 EAL domain-containing protein [Aestuariirhabdus haliotis]